METAQIKFAVRQTAVVSLVVFGMSGTMVSTVASAAPLSLGDAVQLALKQNPSLNESREKVNQTKTEIPLARSALFPNVSGLIDQTRNKDATLNSLGRFGGNQYDQYGASIKLSQTLFQIGSLTAIESANKDVRISKLNAEISQRDLISSVIQAYYQVALSARNVETLLQQEKIAQETVSVSARREKSGRSQLLDSLQAKTQLALLRGQLATAKNNVTIATANLANLTGQKVAPEDYKAIVLVEPPSLGDVDRMFKKSDQPVPEIQVVETSILKIPDQRRVLLGQNLPTLGIAGSYNYTSYTSPDLFEPKANSWTVGLQLTIPIFSGFSLDAQDQALKSQETQLKFDKDRAENLVSYQQVTNRKNLETANESIQTGNEGMELANASLKEARRNYGLGTIDFLQYLTVQQTQVQAEQSLNAYKYNYVVALANYYVAYNADLGELVTTLNHDAK